MVNASGAPAGGFVTRSAGGYTIARPAKPDCVGGKPPQPPSPAPLPGQVLSGDSEFALLVGETGGESGGNASWALDHAGATHHWGPDGGSHTALLRHTKGSGRWDPPALVAGGMAMTTLAVEGAEPGDACAPSLTSMRGLGQLTCHVREAGVVEVVLMAGAAMDVPSGEARAVVSKFAW